MRQRQKNKGLRISFEQNNFRKRADRTATKLVKKSLSSSSKTLIVANLVFFNTTMLFIFTEYSNIHILIQLDLENVKETKV